MEDSVKYVLDMIREKHQALIQSIGYLANSLVSNNEAEKTSRLDLSIAATKNLKGMLTNNNMPLWLVPFEKILNNHKHSPSVATATAINNFLLTNMQGIKGYKWAFNTEKSNSFDFDSIFEKHKAESNLPVLFDDIIEKLQEIYDTNEVDSVKMMRGLEKVIATIKKSKDGSYFSLNSGWQFMLDFLKNYMWQELGNIAFFGPMFKALEQTLNNTNEEMFKVHTAVKEEMERTVGAEIKALENKSEFDFLTYDRNAAKMPTLQTLKAIELKA
jgi:hypothetical protein